MQEIRKKVLICMKEYNYNLQNASKDFWKERTWKVFEDGSVDYIETYCLSGTKIYRWVGSRRQLERWYSRLKEQYYQENYDESIPGYDGVVMNVAYLGNNGKLIDVFHGYFHKGVKCAWIVRRLRRIVRSAAEVVDCEV